jgi:hypothetical protein
MELSKRRERELHKLSTDASDLWHKQRDLFGRAGELLREAGRSAGDIGRDEVYPKTRDSLEHALAPCTIQDPQGSAAIRVQNGPWCVHPDGDRRSDSGRDRIRRVEHTSLRRRPVG